MKFCHHIQYGTAPLHADCDDDIFLQYWIKSSNSQKIWRQIDEKLYSLSYTFIGIFTYFGVLNLFSEYFTRVAEACIVDKPVAGPFQNSKSYWDGKMMGTKKAA